MKITKRQLRKIIKEELEQEFFPEIPLDFTPPVQEMPRSFGDGGDARMAKGQLFHIAKNAQSLHDRLNDEDQLPEWAQSKIAVMKSMLDAVHDHLDYKIHREDNE